MATLLKWKNKFSGEEGFVKSIKVSEEHFVNTFDASEAKQYKSEALVKKDITTLKKFGEAENNDFMAVTV